MILGRTPVGLIKTKSDGTLGLRVVNCACCGECGCSTQMGELKDIMRGITSSSQLTCNGVSPFFFNITGETISAFFDFSIGDDFVSTEIFISQTTDCFTVSGYAYASTLLYSGIISEDCPCAVDPFVPVTCSEATFEINGIEFPAVNEVSGDPVFPGLITFVIT